VVPMSAVAGVAAGRKVVYGLWRDFESIHEPWECCTPFIFICQPHLVKK
jgi:hypothetical protein